MKNFDPLLDQINEEIEKKRANYQGPFCCLTAHTSIEENRGPLRYESDTRNYLLDIKDDYAKALAVYCPWCSKKFPEPLDEEWNRILTEEYGIKWPDLKENKHKIPKEFHTDEWWKKRGL